MSINAFRNLCWLQTFSNLPEIENEYHKAYKILFNMFMDKTSHQILMNGNQM